MSDREAPLVNRVTGCDLHRLFDERQGQRIADFLVEGDPQFKGWYVPIGDPSIDHALDRLRGGRGGYQGHRHAGCHHRHHGVVTRPVVHARRYHVVLRQPGHHQVVRILAVTPFERGKALAIEVARIDAGFSGQRMVRRGRPGHKAPTSGGAPADGNR